MEVSKVGRNVMGYYLLEINILAKQRNHKRNKADKLGNYILKNGKRGYICNPKGAGTIAQLVEQRTENPCVAGSIPAGTTKKPQRNLGFCC